MKSHSQKFLQKRKFAMVLPMLVLPFLTMIFWSLGGGQGSPDEVISVDNAGLNLELPDANFNNEVLNKLALYEKAERDSLKFKEERENDPYFSLATLGDPQDQEIEVETPNNKQFQKTKAPTGNSKKVDANEERVNQKLEQLYRELNKPAEPVAETNLHETANQNASDPQFTSDVQQLEKLMDMMKAGNEADPEMVKIDGMLEKIIDIQHPDRLREKIKEQSEQKKGQVFPVQAHKTDDYLTLLSSSQKLQQITADSSALVSSVFSKSSPNSFYGLDDEALNEQETGNAIEAVVHDTQELVAGSTVKMRLQNDAYVNGKLIPKDQFIYGTAAISGERLTIEISSIRYNNSLFPVSLSAYDLDGMEGIYIPGAITRDAAKQSSDQTLQAMQFMTMDQSLGAQAASAGIQAAKGLFSKKVKLVKVTVKAGYQVLLKDTNQIDNP